jgi:putative ABC transport system substrate-binding protein
MRRRDFIGILGAGVVASPLKLRAPQPTMPLVGVLNVRAAGEAPQLLAAFRKGLKDSGFVEGQNVAIEYRFADNQSERLPELANDLVRHKAVVIAATNTCRVPRIRARLARPVLGGDGRKV